MSVQERLERKIYIGATYYPEQWPRERWPEDIRLMKEAGIDVLRLAESAWAKLEPEDGKFDFSWLDDFMQMAADAGFKIILGTPTEFSTVWLRHKHPEIVVKDKHGRALGGRGNHCHNSRALLEHTERLVTRMARHYAHHPAVIGWQIDNELRGTECYCETCAELFRTWLKEKYGTLDRLNEAWGTTFWSQVYNRWEEVVPPTADQMCVSLSQMLDYSRFNSDSSIKFIEFQAGIIRKYAPHHFVTHNSPCVHWCLDQNKLYRHVDFVSWDLYPHVDSDNFDTAFGLDFHRGLRQDNIWIMEQKNGYFNYSDYNLAIEPGIVRMWAYQDIARGADAVLFYNWRSTRYNYEQNPNGILRHDGSPRRVYYEVQRLTRELAGFGDRLIGTKVEAPVAILHSFDIYWAFESHKQYKNFDYRRHIMDYYKALVRLGITPDIVDPLADLSRYKLVIAPSLMMVNEDMKRHLESYVRSGGCLVIGARSGMKTWENVTIDTPWPGLLRELAGVIVDEFEVLPDHMHNTISYKGKLYDVKVWLDLLEPETADTVAIYTRKFYAGRTAIARNRFGDGTVYYVGVMGSEDLLRDLVTDLAEERGIRIQPLPPGVFVSRRVNERECYTFYVNVTPEPAKVTLAERGTDVISGKKMAGEAIIGGLDVLILRSERDGA